MLLSPLGEVEPTRAAKLPEWPPLTTVATPVVVQPLSVPVSKPPLTMPLPPPLDVTVSETLVVWVAEEPVPVTVSG